MYNEKDLDLDFLRLPSTNNGLQCLKDLSLFGLKLTDQYFELLVSNCTILESLSVQLSNELKNVSIVGLSKLKRLNLSSFMEVESIVIHDTISLVSLTLQQLSSGCTVQLNNTPKLTKLNFGESFGKFMLAEFLDGMPSCICDQLQVMHLLTSVDFFMHKSDLHFYDELFWIDLVNIKHLELEIKIIGFCRSLYMLRHFCRLVEACTSLDKLVIKCTCVPAYDICRVGSYVGQCKLSFKYLEIT
ncbi:uncharacterized protein LOC125210021 [Salvia hispanica]|uniref:uncharacterized protein LOC125210021 n=1 Tax=Salvia hispanica TaxID=49212 RepID=UPI002009C8EF|nr:uncharacterized protein LOC125210021 [Salvia hispanica]